jgi:hypothetical protein
VGLVDHGDRAKRLMIRLANSKHMSIDSALM